MWTLFYFDLCMNGGLPKLSLSHPALPALWSLHQLPWGSVDEYKNTTSYQVDAFRTIQVNSAK